MRKLLWKKAAITAMAGTMMMMTGCELQGAVKRIKRHPQQNSTDEQNSGVICKYTAVKCDT